MLCRAWVPQNFSLNLPSGDYWVDPGEYIQGGAKCWCWDQTISFSGLCPQASMRLLIRPISHADGMAAGDARPPDDLAAPSVRTCVVMLGIEGDYQALLYSGRPGAYPGGFDSVFAPDRMVSLGWPLALFAFDRVFTRLLDD